MLYNEQDLQKEETEAAKVKSRFLSAQSVYLRTVIHLFNTGYQEKPKCPNPNPRTMQMRHGYCERMNMLVPLSELL